MQFQGYLQIIAVVQFLLVSGFLLTTARGKKETNILLAAFLLTKAFCFATGYIADHYPLTVALQYVLSVAIAFEFVLGPSLYLYARSLMEKDFHLSIIQLLHLLPGVFYLIIYGIAFGIGSDAVSAVFFSNSLPGFLLISGTYYQYFIYCALTLISLRKFHDRLKQNYSSIGGEKMQWLVFLVVGCLIIWLSAYVDFIAETFRQTTLIPWEAITMFVFLFANAIVYMGMKVPGFFAGLPADNGSLKYARTALQEEQKDAYLEKIISFMKTSKPYLNPTITLDEFAEQLSIPPHHVSQVLNMHLNKNFFDFINAFRVEECKSLFDKNPGDTILQILFEAGFNSKASFNRAFKKSTGMTPSQYRQYRHTSTAYTGSTTTASPDLQILQKEPLPPE